jgi:hypothetical protein
MLAVARRECAPNNVRLMNALHEVAGERAARLATGTDA